MNGETDFVWGSVNGHDEQEYATWASIVLRSADGIPKHQGYDDPKTIHDHVTYMIAELLNHWAMSYSDYHNNVPNAGDAIAELVNQAYHIRANA